MSLANLPILPTGYRTREVSLLIEGIPIVLTLIQNLDELLQALIAEGVEQNKVVDDQIPYWAELWPAALALSRHLVRTSMIQPGTQVLEMGCGLGLPGVVAGKLGAAVTLTDFLPDALAFAKHNWMQNLSKPAHFELLDWRHPRPKLAADLVLASDIAYEKRSFAFLPDAFRTLCRPGGTILVADPSRSSAPEFFESLPDQHFSVDVFHYIEPYNGHDFRIQVYAIKPL